MIPDVLAQLELNRDSLPLDPRDREFLISWLKEVAGELEEGKHWGTQFLTLGKLRRPDPPPRAPTGAPFTSTGAVALAHRAYLLRQEDGE